MLNATECGSIPTPGYEIFTFSFPHSVNDAKRYIGEKWEKENRMC